MDKQFKFTDARIRALPANPSSSRSTELEVSDTELTGLKCLSGRNGSKRFLLHYTFNSRKRSITLGRFPDIDVATARKAARRYRSMLAEGIDPKAEQEEQSLQPTLSEFFWQTYLPYQKKHTRSWGHEIKRFLNHIEPRPVPAETFKDLKHHLLEGFPSEAQARQYWEDTPTVLILLEPEDGPDQLEQASDNVQRQIQFVLAYPEFVVSIAGGYRLALGIFSDEGSGIYLLVHNQCPIAQELADA